MTDIKSKLAAIRALCDEVEKAVPEPVKEEKVKVWNPRIVGQSFFSIIASGLVWEYTYRGILDNDAISIGNAFPTREAAEKELKRRIVTQKLRELAGGLVPDWGVDFQRRYFLVYDCRENCWAVGVNDIYVTPGVIYFQHRETLEAAIKTLGAELDVLL